MIAWLLNGLFCTDYSMDYFSERLMKFNFYMSFKLLHTFPCTHLNKTQFSRYPVDSKFRKVICWSWKSTALQIMNDWNHRISQQNSASLKTISSVEIEKECGEFYLSRQSSITVATKSMLGVHTQKHCAQSTTSQWFERSALSGTRQLAGIAKLS